jgi:hypothetical protein
MANKKGQTTIYKTLDTKDRATQTPLQTGDGLMCTGRVNSSCSTSGTRRVGPVTNVIFGFAIY